MKKKSETQILREDHARDALLHGGTVDSFVGPYHPDLRFPAFRAYINAVRNALFRQNRSNQADFQEQRVIRLMKKPILSSGKIWFQPPNKFRREVKGSSPSLTVSDGRQLWIYYPNFKSAERYPLGKGSPIDSTVAAINSALNLENIENTFQITPTKSDNGYELA